MAGCWKKGRKEGGKARRREGEWMEGWVDRWADKWMMSFISHIAGMCTLSWVYKSIGSFLIPDLIWGPLSLRSDFRHALFFLRNTLHSFSSYWPLGTQCKHQFLWGASWSLCAPTACCIPACSRHLSGIKGRGLYASIPRLPLTVGLLQSLRLCLVCHSILSARDSDGYRGVCNE